MAAWPADHAWSLEERLACQVAQRVWGTTQRANSEKKCVCILVEKYPPL
jgi:hypothetical protein